MVRAQRGHDDREQADLLKAASYLAMAGEALARLAVTAGRHEAEQRRLTAPAATTKARQSPSQAARKASAKPKRWFAPGEAGELIRKHIRKPHLPSEVVRILMQAKGDQASMNRDDRQRLYWAARSAMKLAVQTGRLIKRPDGRLVAAAKPQRSARPASSRKKA